MKLSYNSFAVFSFLWTLRILYFKISVNGRVLVLTQPILVLSMENEKEDSLKKDLRLKQQINFRWGN